MWAFILWHSSIITTQGSALKSTVEWLNPVLFLLSLAPHWAFVSEERAYFPFSLSHFPPRLCHILWIWNPTQPGEQWATATSLHFPDSWWKHPWYWVILTRGSKCCVKSFQALEDLLVQGTLWVSMEFKGDRHWKPEFIASRQNDFYVVKFLSKLFKAWYTYRKAHAS